MTLKVHNWVLSLLIIAILVIGGCSEKDTNSASSQTKDTVKIGVVLPLTGGAAFIGEGMRDAMQLALEELQGGKYNYNLIFEDDGLDPKKSSSAAQKLIFVDNVDAIVSVTSGTGNIVSPYAQENNVLHIGIASDLKVADGGYNFIHWTSPQEESRVFVEELKNRGLKNLAVIELNQQGVKAIVDGLSQRLEGTDVELKRYLFNFGEKDFKTQLLKAEKQSPDIILLMAFSPELELIAKQKEELGISVPVTAIEALEFTEDPKIFEGMWYVNAADATKGFVDKFNAKYGKNPAIAAPNAYDSVNMIVTAFENSGTDSAKKPSTLGAAMELETLNGFSGAMGAVDVLEGGIFDTKAVVRKVEDGKFVTIRK